MATFAVDTPFDTLEADDQTSLREAILAANANPGADTITFADSMVGQTIAVDRALGSLTITDDVKIEGRFHDNPETLFSEKVTLDGGGKSRVFEINDGDQSNDISVEISDLRVINGFQQNERGAGLSNHESLVLRNVDFVGNQNVRGGRYARVDHAHGAAIGNYGHLEVDGGEFVRNHSESGGSAIYNDGEMLIQGAILKDNGDGGYGGAVYNDHGAQLTVDASNFVDNRAVSGGAIANYGDLSVSGTHFGGNSAVNGGGAIYNPGDAHIGESVFDANFTVRGGGAIETSGSLRVGASTFQGSHVPDEAQSRYMLGGAILVSHGDAHIVDSEFSENHARLGGAVYARGGSTEIEGSEFIENTARTQDPAVGRGSWISTSDRRYGRPAYRYAGLKLAADNVFEANRVLQIGNSNLARAEYNKNSGAIHQVESLEETPVADDGVELSSGVPTVISPPNQLTAYLPTPSGRQQSPGVESKALSPVGRFGRPPAQPRDIPTHTGELIVDTALDEVDFTNDQTSLREAILMANARPGHDTITFHADLAGAVVDLVLRELSISDDLTITGLADDADTPAAEPSKTSET